jgi:hypothetical protein
VTDAVRAFYRYKRGDTTTQLLSELDVPHGPFEFECALGRGTFQLMHEADGCVWFWEAT